MLSIHHLTAAAFCCLALLSCQTNLKPIDGNYPDEALEHEVAVAKKTWLRESVIAERIAKLRSDDAVGRGIRREWIGPAWVKGRVTPEESRYFERIWAVYLGGTKVTDTDARALAELQELRELYLHSTAVTDAGLTRMASLQNLRILHLHKTRVSDKGSAVLAHLTSLRHLYLHETSVTQSAAVRLRSTLPSTEIVW